ncbi:MAG: methyltransferase, partial [Cohaesibacter sp.]|nr:methyltransferase [Cohaesibacter sp.]
LASAVPAENGQEIVELGCGTGAAALCLLNRCKDVHVVGIERNPDHVYLANQSSGLNHFSARLSVLEADVQAFHLFPEDALLADGVMINPPYFQGGNTSQDRGRAAANHEDHVVLADWIGAASHCLKPKGHLTIIHAADRLADILQALGKGFGAIEVIPLWPKQGRDAKRVIVRAMKGRKTPLQMRAGLVLHHDDGSYTNAANA